MKPLLLFLLAALLSMAVSRAVDLPSRNARVVVPQLRAFGEHDGFPRIVGILGAPDTDMISGFSITVFRLKDGSSIYVKATPSHNRIYNITRSAPGELAQVIYEPIPRILMHPAPASAPF